MSKILKMIFGLVNKINFEKIEEVEKKLLVYEILISLMIFKERKNFKLFK